MNRFTRAGLVAAVGLLVLGGALYAFRLELALELASVASDFRYQAGPTQEIAWSSGTDPQGRPPSERPPNVVLILADDLGWNDLTFGGGGVANGSVPTPNIDSIAANGVRFDRAFVPAPVCSACRSAMMGGMNQIRFGAHEHRSSRTPDAQLYLPKGMKLLPQIMQEGGYFTANLGKTDYNFVWDQAATYTPVKKGKLKGHTDSWETLKQNQPFFVQMQTRGGKSPTKKLPKNRKTEQLTR